MIQLALRALATIVCLFVAYLAFGILWALISIGIENVVKMVRVLKGDGMAPGLPDGSRIIMWKAKKKRLCHGKIVYVPKIGIPRRDGIVDNPLRIIGMPGDVVEVNGKAVFLNGRVLDEPYAVPPDVEYEYQKWEVPEDAYFVLGDNRPVADDSRHHGPIPKWNVPEVMLCDITDLLKRRKNRAGFRKLEQFCEIVERGNHYL